MNSRNDPKQAQLAEREYKQLRRRLQNVREGRMQFLSNAVATVNRGLSWPLLTPSDQMVLSMLHGPLARAEKEGMLVPEVLSACIEGVDLLICRASQEQCAEWADKIRQVSTDALVPWLKGLDSGISDWDL